MHLQKATQGAWTSVIAYRGEGEIILNLDTEFQVCFQQHRYVVIRFCFVLNRCRSQRFQKRLKSPSAFQFVLEFEAMLILRWFSSPPLRKSTHHFLFLLKQNLLYIPHYSYVFPVDSWVLFRNSLNILACDLSPFQFCQQPGKY